MERVEKNLRLKRNVVMELLQTERTYVDNMRLVNTVHLLLSE